jgi:hypothetical protein
MKAGGKQSSQKIKLFITTAVRNSNPTQMYMDDDFA